MLRDTDYTFRVVPACCVPYICDVQYAGQGPAGLTTERALLLDSNVQKSITVSYCTFTYRFRYYEMAREIMIAISRFTVRPWEAHLQPLTFGAISLFHLFQSPIESFSNQYGITILDNYESRMIIVGD